MFIMLNKIVNSNLKHTKEKGNEKNSKTIQNKIGAKLRGVGGLVLGGLGGVAYAGGITSLSGISISSIATAITAGASAGASSFALPVIIGAGAVGGVGAALGYGIFGLFD